MEQKSQSPLSKATNIVWHQSSVDREARSQQRGHRSAILWFTGLSGSGKSTLANAVNVALHKNGYSTYVLDGDTNAVKTIIPASRNSLETSPILLIFSSLSRSENPKSLHKPCLMLSPSKTYVE